MAVIVGDKIMVDGKVVGSVEEYLNASRRIVIA